MSRVLEVVQEELAELRAQVARLERIEAELTGEAVPPGPRKLLPPARPRKAGKREGEQRRPPSRGSHAERREALTAQMRKLLEADPKLPAEVARKKLGCSWNLANDLLKQLRK